jgi:ethanolamine kinase
LLSRYALSIGETTSHALLASRGLAPPLLARFQNGLLYRFIRGRPATHLDLVKPPLWRGVARRLGQWHAVLPAGGHSASSSSAKELPLSLQVDVDGQNQPKQEDALDTIKPRVPGPNMWTVLQKWILALPTTTEEQRARRRALQKELERVVRELDDGRGLGDDGVCSLISLTRLLLTLNSWSLPIVTSSVPTSSSCRRVLPLPQPQTKKR